MKIALFVILCLIAYLAIGYVVNVLFIRSQGKAFTTYDKYFDPQRKEHLGALLGGIFIWPFIVGVVLCVLAYRGTCKLLKSSLDHTLQQKG